MWCVKMSPVKGTGFSKHCSKAVAAPWYALRQFTEVQNAAATKMRNDDHKLKLTDKQLKEMSSTWIGLLFTDRVFAHQVAASNGRRWPQNVLPKLVCFFQLTDFWFCLSSSKDVWVEGGAPPQTCNVTYFCPITISEYWNQHQPQRYAGDHHP